MKGVCIVLHEIEREEGGGQEWQKERQVYINEDSASVSKMLYLHRGILP